MVRVVAMAVVVVLHYDDGDSIIGMDGLCIDWAVTTCPPSPLRLTIVVTSGAFFIRLACQG